MLLIGLLVFAVRSFGPANFGLSAVGITALVVFLISFVGASPEPIVHYRAIDTLLGGALSLVAYAVWPSWERSRTPTTLADMLDVYRRYAALVLAAYQDLAAPDAAELDRVRPEARLARSNAEASIERMRSEPARSAGDLDHAEGILASSHRFIQSIMMLEAALSTPSSHLSPAAIGTVCP